MHTSRDSALEDGPDRPLSRASRRRERISTVLDAVIVVYAIAFVISAAGGIDLGWLTLNEAAKPLLVLLVVVPVRLTLGPSWLTRHDTIRSWWTRAAAAGRSGAGHVPAAIRDAGFAFAIVGLASLAVGFFVNILYPPDRVRPFAMPFAQAALAETFAAWDSGWYFDIATRGYYFTPDGQSSIAFFPLYPMLMRALAWPFGSTEAAVWGAGIAISCVSLFAGLIVLHRLTERLFGDREVARRTVLLMAVFPFSFFLTRVYPSGLFFLLTVLSVSAAYRAHWWWAGIAGGLATLTRPHGMLIALPLILLALQGSPWRAVVGRLLRLAPIPAAFLGYSLYAWSIAGHPLSWLSSQNQWGFSLGHPPWEQLLGVIARVERYGLYDYFFTSRLAAYRLFHAAAAIFLLAVTPLVFKRLGAPLGVWVLAVSVIPLTGNALEGIGRYGAVLFPVFMVLGLTRSARLHETLLIVWSMFLALFVGLFVTWHPIY